MTVIAFDGESLACDSLANISGIRATTKKIFTTGNLMYGGAGDQYAVTNMVEWIKAGAVISMFPESQKGDDFARFMVIDKDKRILIYEKSPHPLVMEGKRMAIGSGADFAMTAMYLGMSAHDAVGIAIELCESCGGEIQELRRLPKCT